MISVCDHILGILNNGGQANGCIEWAEKEEYPIHMKYASDVSLQKAQAIVDECTAANAKKNETILPSLFKQSLTVKDLYECLGKLLASNESLQDTQVYHVEFGATTQTNCVEYSPKITGLILGQYQ